MRRLRAAERELAETVLAGTVDLDRARLSGAVGLGGRAFTVPLPGVGAVLALGRGVHDPTGYTGFGSGPTGVRAPGQLLVHALVHAWQLERRGAVAYLWRGAREQLGGGDPYAYGPQVRPWEQLGLEQQAAVVDGWFAGWLGPPGPQSGEPPRSRSSPWWPVVRDGLRGGA
ncbi:hypothetical protein GCM10027047_22650 [Rhodococcus aerolatus]